MLVVNNKRYKKKYAIGESGIFDTILSCGKKLLTSNAAKQAGKHIVDNMLQARAASAMMRPAPAIAEPVYEASQVITSMQHVHQIKLRSLTSVQNKAKKN